MSMSAKNITAIIIIVLVLGGGAAALYQVDTEQGARTSQTVSARTATD
jgi:hypothetical protein